MSRLARALLAFVTVVTLCLVVGAARPEPARTRTLSTSAGMDLSGIALPVAWMVQVDLRARARLDLAVALQEAARRAAAQRQQAPRRQSQASGGGVTGSCAAMAPPGFPGYIVQRESRGDPNAVNSSSGALGCAQILPSHFSRDCAGLGYAACWAKLWDGGNGASHWSTG